MSSATLSKFVLIEIMSLARRRAHLARFEFIREIPVDRNLISTSALRRSTMFMICSYPWTPCGILKTLLTARWPRSVDDFKREESPHGRGHYDPHQPRVPKGNREGGQWTHGWLGESWVELALSKARKRIELWRQKHARRDFWGRKPDPKKSAVATTTINGQSVFGTNSKHHKYEAVDRLDRREKERIIIEKYSEELRRRPITEFPGQAMKHAEVTVLLRAARRNGGTLAGQTLDVEIDRKLCPSCEIVLPLLGRELGNPTVTFTDSAGRRFLMSRGSKTLRRLEDR